MRDQACVLTVEVTDILERMCDIQGRQYFCLNLDEDASLKAMQTYDAFQALVEAKAPLAAERATYNPTGMSLVDDLTRRIDVACTPYFVR